MKFLNRRKDNETSDEMPSLQDDVTRRGKPALDDDREEALVTQINNLEGMVNKRTRDLEEAKEQLKKLYGPPHAGEKAEDNAEDKAEALLTRPNQSASKSAGRQTGEEQDEEKELDNILEKVGGEKAEEPKSEETEEAGEEQSDADNFFGEMEEEENPLAGLISSLPDVNIEELLHDVEEIKELATEWLRGEE